MDRIIGWLSGNSGEGVLVLGFRLVMNLSPDHFFVYLKLWRISHVQGLMKEQAWSELERSVLLEKAISPALLSEYLSDIEGYLHQVIDAGEEELDLEESINGRSEMGRAVGADSLLFNFIEQRDEYLQTVRSSAELPEIGMNELVEGLVLSFQIQLLKLLIEECQRRTMFNSGPLEGDSQLLKYLKMWSDFESKGKSNGARRLRDFYLEVYYTIAAGPGGSSLAKFEKVFVLMQQQIAHLEKEELLSCLNYLQNYLIICINSRGVIHPELVVKSKFGLAIVYLIRMEKELILHEGILEKRDFKNVLSIFLDLELINEWEIFVKRYGSFLKRGDRQWLIKFAEARILFVSEDYGKAVRVLQQCRVPKNDAFDRLDVHSIQIKCLIMLEEWKSAKDVIAASRRYIQRHPFINEKKLVIREDRLAAFLQLISLLMYFSRWNSGGYAEVGTLRRKYIRMEEMLEANPDMLDFDFFCSKVDSVKKVIHHL